MGEGCEIVYAGVCPPAGRAGAGRGDHLRGPGAAASSSAAVSAAGAAGLLRAGARGAAAAPEHGGRAAARDAGGGAATPAAGSARCAGWTELPALARAVTVDRLDLGFVDMLSHEGWLDHPLLGSAGGAVLAAGAGGEHRAAAEPVPGGGPGGGGQRTGPPSRSSPGWLQADPDARWQELLEDDRARAQRQAVGLPGLRLRHLRSCSPRRRRWAGRRCGSARRTRSAGSEEAQRDAAVDALTGLATYRVLHDRLTLRDRAQQAEPRGLRGAVHRPRPVQAGERPVRARGGERGAAGGGGRDPERGPGLGPGGPLRRR